MGGRFSLIIFSLFINLLHLRSGHGGGFLRSVYPTPKQYAIDGDSGEPLFLTPLIKANKIMEARIRSTVPDFLTAGVQGNAGFVTVNEIYSSNLFFWFFRKQASNWKAAPLLLWLQGGPGASSLYGLFTENGPYVVDENGLKLRHYSWTKEYNVLFVDNPVGTGFSFTKHQLGYARDQSAVAADLHSFLTQFFRLYPELTDNEFYISGESYAGKYIPALGQAIHERNQSPSASVTGVAAAENDVTAANGSRRINLSGMLIGNGFSDPINMIDYGLYLHRLSLIDSHQMEQFQAIEDKVRLLIRAGRWSESNRLLDELVGDEHSLFYRFTGFPVYYDYRFEKSGLYDFVYAERFIQTAKIRKALHVGNLTYNDGEQTYRHLSEDITKSVKPYVEQLLNYYPIVFYSGQVDVIVPYPFTENFLRKLSWTGANAFEKARRNLWHLNDGRLAGYYKKYGNLIEVMVHRAGHMVPTAQPKAALELLKRFIEHKFH